MAKKETPKREYIQIRGAKAHNLQDISVDIPRGEFVVVTGLSGSGKSSLAFDTIYAEGQRRYMDTLSPYAKHFMGILEKPDVEEVHGLSPIIAIEQKTTGNNPRSTVGTITEIYDFLRLLYAKASRAYSPTTGLEMVHYTDSQIVDLIMERFQGKRCVLLAPLVRGRKGNYKDLLEQSKKRGFSEIRVDGTIYPIEDVPTLDRYKGHFIELVVDKLVPKKEDEKRVRDSVTVALTRGKGSLAILDWNSGEVSHFSKHLIDPDTGLSLQEPQPHTFSFNSPEGYCPHCKGLGKIVDVDMDRIIPDRNKSIAEGAIVPLGKVRENRKFEIIRAIARKYGFSIYDPVATIPDECITLLVYGSDELFRVGEGRDAQMESFGGIVEKIDDEVVCPLCHGTRLKAETQYFKIDGKTISEVSALEITDLAKWIDDLPGKLSARERAIGHDILKELQERIHFLLDVGLDYLTLDRPTATLSGGESQRIRLATQIGSRLVNVLYILDEPSIGLHQRDNRKLISSLKELRDEGNSIMVVEHDAETMNSSDWIVDVGPGAGSEGGKICLSAPTSYILGRKPLDTDAKAHALLGDSLTVDYLQYKRSLDVPPTRRKGNGKFISIKGASGNNLKGIDVNIPLGCLVGVSGVSGSGKSSLINETLMPYLHNVFYPNSTLHPLPFDSIEGKENIDKMVVIDQGPIGKTLRSNPATYTGVFTSIRELFASTVDAKVRGMDSGTFSFNVKGGRCEECKGAGIKIIEMNFLPSVHVPCEACRGKRYRENTLEVKYKGKSISDVLEMSISEACEFFRNIPDIEPRLRTMVDVGMGYVKMGQSAVTLSGGESQRMKLSEELSRKDTGNTLYILDEPTTGLHFEDIKVLLSALQRLVERGNTVIIIEHNLDVLKSVDYLLDMGPGGGAGGGRIVSKGTPEEVAEDPSSPTGPFLREVLK